MRPRTDRYSGACSVESGRSRGFAVVTLPDADACLAFVDKWADADFEGRKLVVRLERKGVKARPGKPKRRRDDADASEPAPGDAAAPPRKARKRRSKNMSDARRAKKEARAQRLAEAEWWRKLERLSIPFNGALLARAAEAAALSSSSNSNAGDADNASTDASADADAAAGKAHAQNLLMPLIHNTGGDVESGRAFCKAFGIPLHYATLLWSNREALQSGDADAVERTHLSFLVGSYTKEFFWFEALECVRRILLGSIIGIVSASAAAAPVMGLESPVPKMASTTATCSGRRTSSSAPTSVASRRMAWIESFSAIASWACRS